jgi:hypothetical protein
MRKSPVAPIRIFLPMAVEKAVFQFMKWGSWCGRQRYFAKRLHRGGVIHTPWESPSHAV